MKTIKEIKINTEYITLGQFIKVINLVSSGGEVKQFLLDKNILVNNETDNRRGRKLYKNDVIEIQNTLYKIC